MAFDQPAQRTTRKARIALEGPSGSGKTYTALRMATGLGGKIGLIDTEHETSQLYADEFTFYPDYMAAPYAPQRYIEKVRQAAAASCDVLVIDSLSHAWMGSGGVLEQVDALAGAKQDNRNAWKQLSPVQRELIETILGYPGHVIVTMRTKDAYAQDPQNPKKKVKVGLAPVQREGVDYEFDVVLALDQDNTATVQKTRVRHVMPVGAEYPRPGQEQAKGIADWLAGGAEKPAAAPDRVLRADGAVGMVGPQGEKQWWWPQDVDDMLTKGWTLAKPKQDDPPTPPPSGASSPAPVPAESAGTPAPAPAASPPDPAPPAGASSSDVLDAVGMNGTQVSGDQVKAITTLVGDLSTLAPDTDWSSRVTEKLRDWTGRADVNVTTLSQDEAADAIEKLTQAKLLLSQKGA